MDRPRDGSEEPLEFPRIEFDAILDLLKQRADEVNHAQDRLQGLLRATRSVVSRLDLNETLRHIVEAACELVDAPYGALGVIAPSGARAYRTAVRIDLTGYGLSHVIPGGGAAAAAVRFRLLWRAGVLPVTR
jgi:hypothetical protein